MPRKPVKRNPVFRRLDRIKASFKRGPGDRKILLHQLRELGKTNFKSCHTYELENTRDFLETFFWERTLSGIPGLKKTKQEVLNRVLEALAERGIFPERTIIRIGHWKFNANALREKVEESISGESKAALARALPKADPIIASVLKGILGESAASDFLKWRKKNPNSTFYAWLDARRVRPASTRNRKK